MKIIHVAEGFLSARVVQAVYADSSWLRTVVELPGAEVAEGLPTGVTTIATCATLSSLFLWFFPFLLFTLSSLTQQIQLLQVPLLHVSLWQVLAKFCCTLPNVDIFWRIVLGCIEADSI